MVFLNILPHDNISGIFSPVGNNLSGVFKDRKEWQDISSEGKSQGWLLNPDEVGLNHYLLFEAILPSFIEKSLKNLNLNCIAQAGFGSTIVFSCSRS